MSDHNVTYYKCIVHTDFLILQIGDMTSHVDRCLLHKMTITMTTEVHIFPQKECARC